MKLKKKRENLSIKHFFLTKETIVETPKRSHFFGNFPRKPTLIKIFNKKIPLK